MKRNWAAQLTPGTNLDDLFVVVTKTLKDWSGGHRLSLVLGDRTGRVNAVLWDDAKATDRRLEAGDIARVVGAVQLYNGAAQVKVEKIAAVERGTVDIADFRESLRDPEEVEDRLRRLLITIENEWLRQLVDSFLDDEAFMSRFRTAPAAKSWHHPFHGGLLLHTTELVELAAAVAPLFPEASRDLLLGGAFLHDLEKIHELEGDLAVDYSTLGRLVGHIVIGHQMTLDRIRAIPGFPAGLKLHLQHLILSHQGELQFSSPVVPKSLEAVLLHHMDDLNAQANAFRRIIGETRARGASWSEWQRLIDRQIWAGPVTPSDDE